MNGEAYARSCHIRNDENRVRIKVTAIARIIARLKWQGTSRAGPTTDGAKTFRVVFIFAIAFLLQKQT